MMTSQAKHRKLLLAFGLILASALLTWINHEVYVRGKIDWRSAGLPFLNGLFATTALVTVAELVTGKNLKVLHVNLIILFALLFFVEIGLRSSGRYDSYLERNGWLYYVSPYAAPTGNNGLYSYAPGHTVKESFAEFMHERKTSGLGFTNRPVPMPKPKGEVRVFCLGDSFVEGIGATRAEAFPAQLEKAFANRYPDIEVRFYNFGMTGNDIVFARKAYEEKLRRYDPDALLLFQNSSDVQELAVRGEMERFTENGFQYKQPPRWEFLYATSHLIRFVAKDVYPLLQQKKTNKLYYESVAAISRHLWSFAKLEKNGKVLKTWIVVCPMKFEFEQNDYLTSSFAGLAEDDVVDINLFPLLKEHLKQAGESPDVLFWPIDQHFNPRGYKLAASLVAHKITPEMDQIVKKQQ